MGTNGEAGAPVLDPPALTGPSAGGAPTSTAPQIQETRA